MADIFLALANFPMLAIASFAGNWSFGQIGCMIYGFSGALTGFVSINTLTAIALERFFVIAWKKTLPLNRIPSRKIISISVSIWVYSSLWAIAPLFGWGSYILEGSLTSCTFDFFTRTTSNRSFVMCIFIFCFGLQCFVIIFSYTIIFVKVIRHERDGLYHNGGGHMVCIRVSNKIKSANIQIKIAKIVLLIIVVFCTSWMPYAIIALIGIYGNASVITPLTSTIPGILAKMSTAINPIIYALIHPKFRKKLKDRFSKSNRLFREVPCEMRFRGRSVRRHPSLNNTVTHSLTKMSDDSKPPTDCMKGDRTKETSV
ncbi:hypothetical protein FSP39_014755 [Pinctada imbricata]|uniref:G-protein coupled receptors family 1 profile domain-containing protein n=1 Tax=Pinctada imbricata TaxID=66713 RepID=A0AA88XZ16_PINIB|nr:hypothetical protein FSP39_014755 [Pinctada imbricata]